MPFKSLRPGAAILLLLAAACGGGTEAPAPQPQPGARRVDESKTGSVAGRVMIEGSVPAGAAIKLSSDPFCARAHADVQRLETFAVADGGLDNVFVYVKDGLGNYYFDVPRTRSRSTRRAAVIRRTCSACAPGSRSRS